MSTVGDILSIMEGFQYHGGILRGYLEYRGGKIFCYLSTPLYS